MDTFVEDASPRVDKIVNSSIAHIASFPIIV